MKKLDKLTKKEFITKLHKATAFIGAPWNIKLDELLLGIEKIKEIPVIYDIARIEEKSTHLVVYKQGGGQSRRDMNSGKNEYYTYGDFLIHRVTEEDGSTVTMLNLLGG